MSPLHSTRGTRDTVGSSIAGINEFSLYSTQGTRDNVGSSIAGIMSSSTITGIYEFLYNEFRSDPPATGLLFCHIMHYKVQNCHESNLKLSPESGLVYHLYAPCYQGADFKNK